MGKIIFFIASGIIILSASVGGFLLFSQETSQQITEKKDESALFPAATDRAGDMSLASDIESELSIRGFRRLAENSADVSLIRTSGEEFILYTSANAGHLYKTVLNTSASSTRLTSSSFPKTSATFFGKDKKGYRAIIQSLTNGHLGFFSGYFNPLTASSSEETPNLPGTALSSLINKIAVNPSFDTVALLSRTSTGSKLEIADFDGSKPKLVTTSPLSDWHISWPEKTTLTLQTPASAAATGIFLAIDLRNNKEKILASNILGLAGKLSPDGKRLLYSETDRSAFNAVTLKIKPVATTTENTLVSSLETFAEKCSWSADSSIIFCAVPQQLPVAEYPDSWYRGEIVTVDQIWSLNPQTAEATKLFDPSKNSELKEFDTRKILVSGDKRRLYLLTKNQALWELDLDSLPKI